VVDSAQPGVRRRQQLFDFVNDLHLAHIRVVEDVGRFTHLKKGELQMYYYFVVLETGTYRFSSRFAAEKCVAIAKRNGKIVLDTYQSLAASS
jgi:hypothetical protein